MCCDVVSDDTCDNCIDVGAAVESTAHSIHCSDGTSGSHELPSPPAAAEGEHCIYTSVALLIQKVLPHTCTQLVIVSIYSVYTRLL